MYKIRLGYGCGIKATLLTNGDHHANLRKARYIGAVLVKPNGVTLECADVAFDEVTQAVYVRLLPDRELTDEGTYGIVINAAIGANEMYSTAVVNVIEVAADAEVGYSEITIDLSVNIVNFPRNVAYTGASPKISEHQTWLVYDDAIDAYVDTGVDVGYSNLVNRYDQKFAEFVTPCIQATDAANTAAANANEKATAAANAASAANDKASVANTAAERANTAASAANNAATAATTAAANADDKAGVATTAATNANNAAAAATTAVGNLNGVLDIIANSECTLAERVEAIAQTLIGLMNGEIIAPKMIVESLVAYLDSNIVTVRNYVPNIAPARAGLFWIVCGEGVVTPAKYFSKGDASVSDWVSF